MKNALIRVWHICTSLSEKLWIRRLIGTIMLYIFIVLLTAIPAEVTLMSSLVIWAVIGLVIAWIAVAIRLMLRD